MWRISFEWLKFLYSRTPSISGSISLQSAWSSTWVQGIPKSAVAFFFINYELIFFFQIFNFQYWPTYLKIIISNHICVQKFFFIWWLFIRVLKSKRLDVFLVQLLFQTIDTLLIEGFVDNLVIYTQPMCNCLKQLVTSNRVFQQRLSCLFKLFLFFFVNNQIYISWLYTIKQWNTVLGLFALVSTSLPSFSF